jgi:spore maturation protein CgeB
MKPAKQYLPDALSLTLPDHLSVVSGRDGEPTLRANGIFLHSKYNPREEASRLIDSAELDPARPVIVIGSGLGYHLLELIKRGYKTAVIEPDPAVLHLAVKHMLADSDMPAATGDPGDVAADPAFKEFAQSIPQILIHPPVLRLHEKYADEMRRLIVHAALDQRRLRVAVVGPMYGGSLPIAGYLERAFNSLGHVTLLVDNAPAWNLYQAVTDGTKTKKAAAQLAEMFTHFLNEWTYARVAEFLPDICVVLAQAPVDMSFPGRLRKDGIVTAFWYVENWRHFPYWKSIAPYYDCFFHIQPGQFEQELTKAGCPVQAYIPTGCDPEIHHPVELTPEQQADLACDISFAGAGYANRIAMFKGLTDYDFKIWGVDWIAYELRALVRNPGQRFSPEDFARIVAASKINLNLHSSIATDGVDANADAVNPRVFEIAACGGFQLCDPCTNLDALFDFDSEIPVYRGLPELRKKLDYFLRHDDDRREYARRARERALRDHTYQKRAQSMLEIMLDHYGERMLRKGVRVQLTMAEMAAKAGTDTPLGKYLSSMPPDMIFNHDNINSLLPLIADNASDPERIFIYLREIRDFAEKLLAR